MDTKFKAVCALAAGQYCGVWLSAIRNGNQPVVARSAYQGIGGIAPVIGAGSSANTKHIVAIAASEAVVAGCPFQRIIVGLPIELVVTCAAIETIIARSAVEHVDRACHILCITTESRIICTDGT